VRAVYVEAFNPDDPVAAVRYGGRPLPEVPPGWVTVEVKAASLNQHDVWSLRGVGLHSKDLPMILGCDAAGLDEAGREVIIHAVVTDKFGSSVLSERHQGTCAERVTVPAGNLIPKPDGLSFAQAACLPTAWLTAYTMLFSRAGLHAGDVVLVQGAGGGLATALVALARAAGLTAWVTSRSGERRDAALAAGADAAFETNTRLPARVDAVMDSVGAATLQHSLNAVRPGGTVVIAGGTSGYHANVNVATIFSKQIRILGAAMGSRDDLDRLAQFCASREVVPKIDRELSLAEAREGIAALAAGTVRGKIVLRPDTN
jgi:NADPH:quinone reductase-like Zn-dependent oxidoreductase